MSQKVEHLRENGPSTYEELPGGSLNISEKRAGICRFSPASTSTGSSCAVGGQIKAVYYLDEDFDVRGVINVSHDMVDVLRVFFYEANPSLVEKGQVNQIDRLIPRDKREAYHEIRDELFSQDEIDEVYHR